MKKKSSSSNQKIKLNIGDCVKIISGKEKGKISKIKNVFKKQNKIIVEGVNIKVKHCKQDKSSKGEQIKRLEFPIHSSNVLKHKE